MATKKNKLQAPVQHTDWTLYVLCQQSRDEALRDPSKSFNVRMRANQKTMKHALAGNLRSLDDLNSLPLSISISRLDRGNTYASQCKMA